MLLYQISVQYHKQQQQKCSNKATVFIIYQTQVPGNLFFHCKKYVLLKRNINNQILFLI